MAIMKQTFIMSVIFNTDETYGESAVDAISEALYNNDGVYDWNVEACQEVILADSPTDLVLSVMSAK